MKYKHFKQALLFKVGSIIMTQDTSIYYVWIGGSCDYGLGERGMRDSVLWRKQSRIIMMKLNNTKSEWFM